MSGWLHSFWDNKGTLLLAFILALTVWVTSINADDPIREDLFPTSIPIEYENLAEGLIFVGQPQSEGYVRLRAPNHVWEQLSSEDIHLRLDLTGFETGNYKIMLNPPAVDLKPVRIIDYDPKQINLTIEPKLTKKLPVQILVSGEPALGYETQKALSDPQEVSLLGPASFIQRVSEVQAEVSINGRRLDLEQNVPLVALDKDGAHVSGIQIEPDHAIISISIQQSERYRLVAVIPSIKGQPDSGYRITKIDVIPDQVIVFSSDPQALEALEGYAETEEIDISGATDQVEIRASLNLAEDIALVGDQSVLVRVDIAPIINSMTITRPIEFQGLESGLAAVPSPDSVTIFLSGPMATLEQLQPEDVRVVLDLIGLDIGTYQIEPQVIFPPTDVESTIMPTIIEVTITKAQPATPTPVPTP